VARIGTKIQAGDVVAITGAGSGLGRALSITLGYRGARIHVSDINPDSVEATATLVREAGGEALTSVVDTRDADAVQAMCDATYSRWGRCDMVVNNAGVGAGGEIGVAPLEDWKFVIDINLNGVLYGCRSFAPKMKADGSGTIVNIASIAAFARAPMMGAYNVSKAAVVALSETLRAECRPHGVGVTVVCPSFFRTNIGKSSRAAGQLANTDISKLVDNSKVSAESVALAILRSAEAGEPYVVPMADAKVMWYLRRLAPGSANALLARGAKLMMKRGGGGKKKRKGAS